MRVSPQTVRGGPTHSRARVGFSRPPFGPTHNPQTGHAELASVPTSTDAPLEAWGNDPGVLLHPEPHPRAQAAVDPRCGGSVHAHPEASPWASQPQKPSNKISWPVSPTTVPSEGASETPKVTAAGPPPGPLSQPPRRPVGGQPPPFPASGATCRVPGGHCENLGQSLPG